MALLSTSLLTLFVFFLSLSQPSWAALRLVAESQDVVVVVGEQETVVFRAHDYKEYLLLSLSTCTYFDAPTTAELVDGESKVTITGVNPASEILFDVVNCSSTLLNVTNCPLDLSDAFVRVTVIHSKVVDTLVDVVGWAYFFAWSISFYPQIILNFRRKSVVGLNFDFLTLNVIGFFAYALFNLLMYFNDHIKEIYHAQHPRAPPPVLVNDVVFAVHAFFACLVTVFQCLVYERENQRVSRLCIVFSGILVLFGVTSAAITVLNILSTLAFVTSLSYIKMAVTLSKYFPQAYFNFTRKSTVGWSIGNVLLDLTGGTLDILQMVLQASNVSDWSSFYTNPVKFGLGLVSIIFDVVFIVQHYVLYRYAEVAHNEFSGIENPEGPQLSPVPNYTGDSTEDPIIGSHHDH